MSEQVRDDYDVVVIGGGATGCSGTGPGSLPTSG
jgi:glycerol-3-phosphate dehydrogenase